MTDDVDPDDEPAKAPEELRLDGDHVQRIDDNRYIIEAKDDRAAPSNGAPKAWAAPVADATERFAVDVVAKTDHGVDRTLLRSNDLRRVFEGMLRWFGARVDPEAPPAEVVDVLLAATDFQAAPGPENRSTGNAPSAPPKADRDTGDQ